MMEYLILSDGLIENIIVCEDDETAALFNALPSYERAIIGEEYNPPEVVPEPTQLDLIEAQIAYTAMMTDTLLEV